MNGIYGPTWIDSFVQTGPLESWESRLRERLGTIGSLEYGLIWRKKDTKLGLSISRLGVSTRRIEGIGFTGSQRMESTLTGWTSPQAHDQCKPDAKRWRRYGTEHRGNNLNDEAAMVVSLTGWPTPTTPSGGQSNPDGTSITGKRPDGGKVTVTLQNVAKELVGWPTPRSSPNENRNTKSAPSYGETHGMTLAGLAQDLTGWPTPTTRYWKNGQASERTHDHNSQPLNEIAVMVVSASGTVSSSSVPTGTENTGVLNPELSRWLQGFPKRWISYAPSATQSIRSLQRK